MQRFTATLVAIPTGGAYVVVPPETAEAAGLRYGVRVRGTVNGVAYRSSLMKYSGVFHMGVHKATIAAAGVAPNTALDVAIEIDDAPLPADTVPKDLARAIAGNAKAKASWATQSPAHRREYVQHVTEAKKAETRERRIAATVTALAKQPAKAKRPARAGTPAKGTSARRRSR